MDKAQKSKRRIRKDWLTEIRFYEGLLARFGDDVEVMQALGDLYTKAGLYERGLELDLKLTKLIGEEPLSWYNLACSQALLDRRDEAISSLAKAIDLGYRDIAYISQDEDLSSLRSDKRFVLLLRRMMP
jgi:tetratricopeptide (TPR) repeat protein